MSKNVYRLVVGVTSGVAAIAIAIVTFINPEYCVAINSSIAVVEGAVAEACSFFVKEK